jgi:hypothetical protein
MLMSHFLEILQRWKCPAAGISENKLPNFEINHWPKLNINILSNFEIIYVGKIRVADYSGGHIFRPLTTARLKTCQNISIILFTVEKQKLPLPDIYTES